MNKKEEIEEIVFDEIESASSKIHDIDLNKIISEEKKISDKSSRLDLGKFKKLINQIKLAMNLLKDFKNKKYTDVPWRTIAMLAASVMYFVNPFDIMPDLLPVLGFADDAILFASLFKSIQADLEKYCHWKGYNPELYF